MGRKEEKRKGRGRKREASRAFALSFCVLKGPQLLKIFLVLLALVGGRKKGGGGEGKGRKSALALPFSNRLFPPLSTNLRVEKRGGRRGYRGSSAPFFPTSKGL